MQQDSIGCPLENRVQWNHKSGQVEIMGMLLCRDCLQSQR
jgi:hypothetical protein